MLLTRRDDARNMARFYALDVGPDLFGGTVLSRRWGRLGTQGREIREWFAQPAEAETARDLWLKRKLGRGYRAGD